MPEVVDLLARRKKQMEEELKQREEEGLFDVPEEDAVILSCPHCYSPLWMAVHDACIVGICPVCNDDL